MIYDCDPADTISALRAANEDLAAQVKHWRGIVIADNPPIEELEFNLRTAKSELEITNAEINRLNGVIEKYRAISPSSNGAEGAGEAAGLLRGWAKAYRDTPEHRFPSDPNAEFFPIDLERAADLLDAPPQPAPDAMRKALREKIGGYIDAIRLGATNEGITNAIMRDIDSLSAPVPSLDGVGELASFGHAPKPFWIIKFEDADRGEMHFGNEIEAHTTFEKASDSWNCTLFETARRKYSWRCDQLVPLSPSGAGTAEPDSEHGIECRKCGETLHDNENCDEPGCPASGQRAATPDWDKIASEYMPATAAPVSEPKS